MPVKPGDSWKLPVAEIIKSTGFSGLVLDQDKATANAELLKVYKRGSIGLGDIEFTFEAPVTSLDPKAMAALKEGKMTIKSTDKGCIDGSSAAGIVTTNMNLLVLFVTGNGMGADVKVESQVTETRTSEPLDAK